MSEVTKSDLSEIRTDIRSLRTSVEEGFKGVHSRQDITNGRVLKVEGVARDTVEQTVRHDERIKTLFRRLHTRSEKPEDEGEDRRITQREVLLVVATVGITVAVLKFLPTLVRLVTP